ncbi:helix-turn-helix domain-containing protein [Arthrobacter sp. NPDC080073]|uniref:TetR/AcrR family transcriptional regulator n=1 Tax=Arthrobacter sp. NPDC080073 TaxID=3155919 RepID=UPI00342F92C6
MSSHHIALGRRERNKQEKLARITAAAYQLFSEHGVNEVTTQQIADAADVGTGTLFFYAKTKAELLLLVHNAAFAEAIDLGVAAARRETDPLLGIMAIVRPIIERNRVQVENGRAYLRELVFGDPEEPHHKTALALAARVDAEVAEVIRHRAPSRAADAQQLAAIISSIMFINMSATVFQSLSVDRVTENVSDQVRALLAEPS